jgi:Zn-dependent protease
VAHLLTTVLVFILRGAASSRAQPAALVIRILPGAVCGRFAQAAHRLIPIVAAFAFLFFKETMRRMGGWATSRPPGLELGRAMRVDEAFGGRIGFKGAAKVEGAERWKGEGEGK